MKKVFLTLALAAFAFAANAQFVLSGNLGFGSQKAVQSYDGKTYYGSGLGSVSDFNVGLKGGYMLNDKFQLGLFLQYQTSTNKVERATTADPYNVNTTYKDIDNNFSVGLYGRMNCVEVGNLSLFAEAYVGIDTYSGKDVTDPVATTDGDYDKGFGLTIGVVPGLNYKLTEKLSLDLYLDFMGLGYQSMVYTSQADNKAKYGSRSFGLNLISGQFSAVRGGFNFAF